MKKSILLAIILLPFLLTSCNYGEGEIVVVPKGYEGYVLVIFNQECGAPIEYADGKRVYRIPESGVLKTQFSSNSGIIDRTEFYYGKIANKNRLSSFIKLNEVPKNKIVGMMGASGTVRKNTKSDKRISFVEFYIGDKERIMQYKENLEKIEMNIKNLICQ